MANGQWPKIIGNWSLIVDHWSLTASLNKNPARAPGTHPEHQGRNQSVGRVGRAGRAGPNSRKQKTEILQK